MNKRSPFPEAARAPVAMVPRFLRPPMAAAYLGISTSRLAELGLRKIKDARLGPGIVVYDRLDLDAFADSLSAPESDDNGGWG